MAAKCCMTKNRNTELCALHRAKMVKLERDQGRAKTLASIEAHNHSKIKNLHKEKRTSYYHY